MATKYYLDQEGLERLVEYINNALSGKANIGDIPANVVVTDDLLDYVRNEDLEGYVDTDELAAELADYIKAQDLGVYIDENELADELDNYVTKSSISDVVREDDLADYATNDDLADLRSEVTGVYHYRGTVENLEELQAIENPTVGDVYNINDTGMNAGWTGEVWDEFGSVVDLTDYLTEDEVQGISIPVVDSILYGGRSAIVSNMDGIKAMIANDQSAVEIKLADDLAITEPIVIPEGKEVTLDLNGNTISGATPIYANGGSVSLKNGTVRSTNGDGVIANNGATVSVDGANIVSTNHNGISATDSEVIINSGSVTSQEAGVAGFKNSILTINGGTITGIDNGAVMGNGSPAGADNDGSNFNVVMNGGTLVGHIQSAGYIACALYLPNTGSFTMNGGEIISDGVGIVMRGGEVILNAGSVTANGQSGVKGKAGDSRVVVGPYAIVYDAQSKYPGVNTLHLVIEDGVELQGTDGDIDVLLGEGYEANIDDLRNI